MPSNRTSSAWWRHWSSVEEDIPTAFSVDCPSTASLCADLDVASFPAIRLYHQDGTKHHFRGPRKASEITAFVRRMLRPAVTPLDDKKAVNSFRDADDVVVVAHLAASEEGLRERFAELAARRRDRHTFGLVTVDEAPAASPATTTRTAPST
ncbi:protein disulfide isomerase [Colletotrichum higginsianum]|nr:protein disulfide isomerase [Colletotrichum higginsianum]